MTLAHQDPRAARAVASDDEIPILDLGPLRAGDPNALASLAQRMRHACENVGFYFIVNHGGARFRDVIELIRLIEAEALARRDVRLEREIRIWPARPDELGAP